MNGAYFPLYRTPRAQTARRLRVQNTDFVAFLPQALQRNQGGASSVLLRSL